MKVPKYLDIGVFIILYRYSSYRYMTIWNCLSREDLLGNENIAQAFPRNLHHILRSERMAFHDEILVW